MYNIMIQGSVNFSVLIKMSNSILTSFDFFSLNIVFTWENESERESARGG